MEITTIGMAESKIAKSPDKMVTLGLGSCVGLVLYDPITRIGGMVHIILPSAPKDVLVTNKFKFADTATVELIRLLVLAGAMRSRLIAKAAGGAHMFNTAYKSDVMNVGQKNIQMCHKVLKDHSIKITGEDTGGTSGRSIEFCCESSMLQVRTLSPKSIRYI